MVLRKIQQEVFPPDTYFSHVRRGIVALLMITDWISWWDHWFLFLISISIKVTVNHKLAKKKTYIQLCIEIPELRVICYPGVARETSRQDRIIGEKLLRVLHKPASKFNKIKIITYNRIVARPITAKWMAAQTAGMLRAAALPWRSGMWPLPNYKNWFSSAVNLLWFPNRNLPSIFESTDFVRSSSGKSKAPSSPPFASSLQGSGTKPPEDCCLLLQTDREMPAPCCFVPHIAEKRKASTAFAQIGSPAASPQRLRHPSKFWKR